MNDLGNECVVSRCTAGDYLQYVTVIVHWVSVKFRLSDCCWIWFLLRQTKSKSCLGLGLTYISEGLVPQSSTNSFIALAANCFWNALECVCNSRRRYCSSTQLEHIEFVRWKSPDSMVINIHHCYIRLEVPILYLLSSNPYSRFTVLRSPFKLDEHIRFCKSNLPHDYHAFQSLKSLGTSQYWLWDSSHQILHFFNYLALHRCCLLFVGSNFTTLSPGHDCIGGFSLRWSMPHKFPGIWGVIVHQFCIRAFINFTVKILGRNSAHKEMNAQWVVYEESLLCSQGPTARALQLSPSLDGFRSDLQRSFHLIIFRTAIFSFLYAVVTSFRIHSQCQTPQMGKVICLSHSNRWRVICIHDNTGGCPTIWLCTKPDSGISYIFTTLLRVLTWARKIQTGSGNP